MPIEIRVLGANGADVLANVADDVFDYPIDSRWTAEFFGDPRHHLAVALDDGQVVGMASAVHYVHPDKAPELWINEVGVAPSHQGRGIGRRILAALLDHGAALGCREAWVLTSPDNEAAQRLYRAAGGEPANEPSVMFTFRIAGEGQAPQGQLG